MRELVRICHINIFYKQLLHVLLTEFSESRILTVYIWLYENTHPHFFLIELPSC